MSTILPVRYDIQKLERARREQGLCLADVAKMCGVSPSTVGRVEAGEISGPRTIKAIADVLGVPMSELIVEEESQGQPAA